MQSKYTGVSWYKPNLTWRATLTSKGVTYDCGYSKDERECARLRDMKIISLKLDKIKKLQVLKPRL